MKNITKKDLEKMGVIHMNSKIHPNKFFIPQAGEVNLYEPYRFEDVLQKVYDKGFQNGINHGANAKINEIKMVLNIFEK